MQATSQEYLKRKAARAARAQDLYFPNLDVLQRALTLPAEVFAAVFFMSYKHVLTAEALAPYRYKDETTGHIMINVSRYRLERGLQLQAELQLVDEADQDARRQEAVAAVDRALSNRNNTKLHTLTAPPPSGTVYL